MDVKRVLRPAQKVLTATVVTVVAASGALSDDSYRPGPDGPAGVPVTEPVQPASAAARPGMSPRTYRLRVLRLVNTARRRHHLRPLRTSSCVQRTAGRWSARLAEAGSLRHQSMRRLQRTCRARYVGETLGRGSIAPSGLVGLWMHSTPHRQVLLSRSARRIGIGATRTVDGRWVVAADLMRR